jgi:uncharacterized membrane protein YbaN (DUF454 family)
VRILADPTCSPPTLAESDEYRVVHSSYGRARVHFANWSSSAADGLVARLQAVPGVTRATANAITQNVLILYDPRQTSLDGVLAETESVWQPERPSMQQVPPRLTLFAPKSPVSPPAVGSPAPEIELEPVPFRPAYVTGIRRTVYKILGWASVGMAVVGILPGIPTAPFVILAGYFFIRSSPTAHQWLLRSRWFGPLLRDWEQHRGVRRSVRNLAVAVLGFSMVLITLLGLPLPLVLAILAMQFLGLIVVLRLRVVEAQPLALVTP